MSTFYRSLQWSHFNLFVSPRVESFSRSLQSSNKFETTRKFTLLHILGQLLFFLDFCIVHKPKMSVLLPSSLQGGIILRPLSLTSIDRPPDFGNHSNFHIFCLRYFKDEIQRRAKMSRRDSKISSQRLGSSVISGSLLC